MGRSPTLRAGALWGGPKNNREGCEEKHENKQMFVYILNNITYIDF
jgi:hypothetical protein